MNAEESSARGQESPVYLIIGAGGGVGTDLCRRIVRRGAKAILAGRDEQALVALAEENDSKHFVTDATDFNQMKECIDFARQAFGRLDGVANCAGSILLKPAHLTSEDEWNSIIASNLTTAFATVKFAAKAMMGQGGSIVLVSSCAARIGLPNHEAIAAAKAGVEGLARSAAATYARHKIRVNCVAPGLLKTKMTSAITSNETQLQASIDMHPLARVGTAGDVTVVMDWLLGDESSWVTGQTIGVDGGLSTVKSARAQARASG